MPLGCKTRRHACGYPHRVPPGTEEQPRTDRPGNFGGLTETTALSCVAGDFPPSSPVQARLNVRDPARTTRCCSTSSSPACAGTPCRIRRPQAKPVAAASGCSTGPCAQRMMARSGSGLARPYRNPAGRPARSGPRSRFPLARTALPLEKCATSLVRLGSPRRHSSRGVQISISASREPAGTTRAKQSGKTRSARPVRGVTRREPRPRPTVLTFPVPKNRPYDATLFGFIPGAEVAIGAKFAGHGGSPSGNCPFDVSAAGNSAAARHGFASNIKKSAER